MVLSTLAAGIFHIKLHLVNFRLYETRVETRKCVTKGSEHGVLSTEDDTEALTMSSRRYRRFMTVLLWAWFKRCNANHRLNVKQ
jgi:hypothetical protein